MFKYQLLYQLHAAILLAFLGRRNNRFFIAGSIDTVAVGFLLLTFDEGFDVVIHLRVHILAAETGNQTYSTKTKRGESHNLDAVDISALYSTTNGGDDCRTVVCTQRWSTNHTKERSDITR